MEIQTTGIVMELKTTRFGQVYVEPDDVLHFPEGVIALEDCRDWVLLADAENSALGWLQSASRPEIALAVVSPRRYVPEYQVRVFQSELLPLQLSETSRAQVLSIVGHNGASPTLNLKAPLLVNLERRLGRQVVTNGDQPTQYILRIQEAPLRKSA